MNFKFRSCFLDADFSIGHAPDRRHLLYDRTGQRFAHVEIVTEDFHGDIRASEKHLCAAVFKTRLHIREHLKPFAQIVLDLFHGPFPLRAGFQSNHDFALIGCARRKSRKHPLALANIGIHHFRLWHVFPDNLIHRVSALFHRGQTRTGGAINSHLNKTLIAFRKKFSTPGDQKADGYRQNSQCGEEYRFTVLECPIKAPHVHTLQTLYPVTDSACHAFKKRLLIDILSDR